MLDVVALGELLIDFASVSADEDGYPTLAAHPGGAPANFLAALSKFGRKTAFLGKVGKDMHLPTHLIYPFVWLGAKIFGNFNLSESSAIEALKHCNIPVLLFHGEADNFVPCEMSKALHTSGASDVTLELFPKAGHGLSYLILPQRYEEAISAFIKRCLD